MPQKTMTLTERLKSKMSLPTNSGCIEWMGAIATSGYGAINICESGSKYKHNTVYNAHRISYELFIGVIPDGLLVLHKCDNRKCVNPDHLFVGNQKENMSDMITKGRAIHIGKLNADKVKEIKERIRNGSKNADIAREFTITQQTICDIKKGRSWRYIK